MEKLIELTANLATVAGLAMCLLAALVRLAGNYHLFGYSLMTIFLAGTGLLVLACLAKVELLLRRSRRPVDRAS